MLQSIPKNLGLLFLRLVQQDLQLQMHQINLLVLGLLYPQVIQGSLKDL